MLLNVFFYKENMHHDGSFFHIYVYNNSKFFNIFFHIEKLVFINCTWLFLNFFRIHNLLKSLNASMVYIFLYDNAVDKDEDSMDLFFFHKFDHMNGIKYLFHTQDLWIYHNNNNILA